MGNWTLVVRDMDSADYTGKLIDWRIQFWGEEQKPRTDDEHVLTEQQQQQVEETIEDREPTPEDAKDTTEDTRTQTHENTSPDNAKVIVDVDSTVNMVLDDHVNNHAPSSSSNSETKASTNALSEETEAEVESSFGRTLYVFCGVLGISAVVLGYGTRHRWMDGRGRYMILRGRRSRGGRRRGGGREAVSSNYAVYNDDNDFDGDHGHIDLLPRTMSSHPQPLSEGNTRLAKDLIPPYQSPSTDYDQFDLGSGSDTDNDDDDDDGGRMRRPQLNVSSPATLPVQEATI